MLNAPRSPCFVAVWDTKGRKALPEESVNGACLCKGLITPRENNPGAEEVELIPKGASLGREEAQDWDGQQWLLAQGSKGSGSSVLTAEKQWNKAHTQLYTQEHDSPKAVPHTGRDQDKPKSLPQDRSDPM
ncbi:unnamed protein product [Caretta caretta]